MGTLLQDGIEKAREWSDGLPPPDVALIFISAIWRCSFSCICCAWRIICMYDEPSPSRRTTIASSSTSFMRAEP
mgnify:CR=1 FL=1